MSVGMKHLEKIIEVEGRAAYRRRLSTYAAYASSGPRASAWYSGYIDGWLGDAIRANPSDVSLCWPIIRHACGQRRYMRGRIIYGCQATAYEALAIIIKAELRRLKSGGNKP